MDNRKLIILIQKELEIINDRIDRKIVSGLSYAREAKQHKTLILKLRAARRKDRVADINRSWLFRSLIRPLGTISTMMF